MEAGDSVLVSPKKEYRYLLFTTPTCTNCRMIEKMLSDNGIAYTLIDATEHQDLVEKYNVSRAPSLVIDSTDEDTKILSDVSKIVTYIRSNPLSAKEGE